MTESCTAQVLGLHSEQDSQGQKGGTLAGRRQPLRARLAADDHMIESFTAQALSLRSNQESHDRPE